MVYAKSTKVEADKTRMEIEQTLRRYGADSFGYMTDHNQRKAAIMFRSAGRHVKFLMEVPKQPQAERSRWRALLLCVKAKLESVSSGIETFEQAFMAHVVLPDGQTMGEWVAPQLKQAYESGRMPEPMLSLPAPEES